MSFLVVLGCVTGAGLLLRLVERPDGSTAFDASITSWMADHRTAGLTTLARLLSNLGSQWLLAPVVGVVCLLLLWRRRPGWAVFLGLAWGGTIVLYVLAKWFVGRPRPPADLWLVHVTGKAFPSGHASQAAATFAALAVVAARWQPVMRWPGAALAMGLAFGVGWSRVYLGVHWTTDVLAGWLTGAAWTALLLLLLLREPSSDPTANTAPGWRPSGRVLWVRVPWLPSAPVRGEAVWVECAVD